MKKDDCWDLEEGKALLMKVQGLVTVISQRKQRRSPLANGGDVLIRHLEALAAGHQLLSILRVPDDRGTVSIQGEHPKGEEFLNGSSCHDCGRVGHIYYRGPDIVSELPGCTGKWIAIGMTDAGESLIECVWCGSVVTSRDVAGPEVMDERLRQFRMDYQAKYGYRVRMRGWL